MVEHSAVNRRVTGSSPVGGADCPNSLKPITSIGRLEFLCFAILNVCKDWLENILRLYLLVHY